VPTAEPIRYAALLRGVNVGGNKKIAMADLRSLLTGLGHQEVKTHLQSGNAVFTPADSASPDGPDATVLAEQIESALAAQLGLASRVLLQTGDQLAAVVEANPFPSADDEPSKHLVQFLFDPLSEADLAGFDAAAFEPEQFRLGAGVVYFRFPEGMGRSKLAVAFGSHTRKITMTGRNWNTVRKLRDLTAAPTNQQ
jgi:uncharacterized protein (DUF1697 family)